MGISLIYLVLPSTPHNGMGHAIGRLSPFVISAGPDNDSVFDVLVACQTHPVRAARGMG